jgi:Protein of unknown function (DUF2924)
VVIRTGPFLPPWRAKISRQFSPSVALSFAPKSGSLSLTENGSESSRKEHAMHPNFAAQLAALQQLRVSALRARYAELFGEPARSGNKAWLVKRLAWRLQTLAEGDLSERARLRAEQLANDADLRLSPPKHDGAVSMHRNVRATPRSLTDPRLPPPGNVLTRVYKGQTLQVRVLLHGFEFQGVTYASLSAVAKAITGSHASGFLFFRLHQPKGDHS